MTKFISQASKIVNHPNQDLQTCDVKTFRFRRELDALVEKRRSAENKQSRIINGVDIEPYSWPWLVRLNFLYQFQFENIEGTSKAGFRNDALILEP